MRSALLIVGLATDRGGRPAGRAVDTLGVASQLRHSGFDASYPGLDGWKGKHVS
jgi:hypothetical protein